MRKYDRKLERKLHDEFCEATGAEFLKNVVPNGMFVRPVPPDDSDDNDLSGQQMLWKFLSRFSNSQLDDLKYLKLLHEASCYTHYIPFGFKSNYGQLTRHTYLFPFRGMMVEITWWRGYLASSFLNDLFDRSCHVSIYNMDIEHSDGKSFARGDLTPDEIRRVLDALAAELDAALGQLEKKRADELKILKNIHGGTTHD